MKKVIWWTGGILTVMFAAGVSYYLLAAESGSGFGKTYEAEDNKMHEETEKAIAEMHHTLNQIIGYGKEAKFQNPDDQSWKGIEYTLHDMKERTKDLIDRFEKENMSLKNDLTNFTAVVGYAAEEREVKALLYSHRIMHDLDVGYNNYREETFGVTNFTGKTNPNNEHELQKLLKKTQQTEETGAETDS